MLERLIFSLVVLIFCILVLLLIRTLHLRRIGRLPVSLPLSAGRPALLYFRSDHCAPCTTQSYYLRALNEGYGGRFSIRQVDVDREPEVAARYGILTLPSTLIVDGEGQVQHINYGLTGAAKLARQLEKVI